MQVEVEQWIGLQTWACLLCVEFDLTFCLGEKALCEFVNIDVAIKGSGGNYIGELPDANITD